MLKYNVCVCCVRFVLIHGIVVNLALACSCLSPMLNLVCYVWLYYSWFFVFNCIQCCPAAWQLAIIVAVSQLCGKPDRHYSSEVGNVYITQL